MIMTESTLLLTILLVWAFSEVPVILTAAAAVLPSGTERLTRLGAVFLGTEAWTLVLFGASHGIIPGPTHEVLHDFGAMLAVFVAGWMIRDLGLWLGPRRGAGVLWRVTVALGGGLQLAGILGIALGLVVVRPELELGAGAGMLTAVAPPVLFTGLCLGVALVLLPRGEYFAWRPECHL